MVVHKHIKLATVVCAVLLSLVLVPALFYKKYTVLNEKHKSYIAANPEPKEARPTLFGLQRQRLQYLLTDTEIEALLKSYREDRKFKVDPALAQRLGEKNNGTLQWLLEELGESFKMQYDNDDEIRGKRGSIITFAKYEYPAFRKDGAILLTLLFAPTILVLLGLYVLEHGLVVVRGQKLPALPKLPKTFPKIPSLPKKQNKPNIPTKKK